MAIVDEVGSSAKRSHLFMLRLWLEDLGRGQFDWRAKIQYVSSGEARYLRDWPALEAFIEGQLFKTDLEESATDGIEETDKSL